MMTRAEHLAWAKERALEYADASQALASIGSDLSKHPETRGHPGPELMMLELLTGGLTSPAQIRRFIEGFH
jgi:hypothetical protein